MGKYKKKRVKIFDYIIKKHGTATDDHLIMIYVNKIENKVTFKMRRIPEDKP